MGRRAGHKERAEETGMILAELAAGLPIIVLLLTFLMVAVLWSRQNYERQIADAELRQEMQSAFARIVESALLSDRIEPHFQGGYEMQRNIETGRMQTRYWVDAGRLVVNYASFPMTGSFAGAGVHISELSIEQEDAVSLYHIRMTGESVVTGHTYTLETRVYLKGQGDVR